MYSSLKCNIQFKQTENKTEQNKTMASENFNTLECIIHLLFQISCDRKIGLLSFVQLFSFLDHTMDKGSIFNQPLAG